MTNNSWTLQTQCLSVPTKLGLGYKGLNEGERHGHGKKWGKEEEERGKGERERKKKEERVSK